jgi:hypothetical protein
MRSVAKSKTRPSQLQAAAAFGSARSAIVSSCTPLVHGTFFNGIVDEPNDNDFAFFKGALFRNFYEAEIVGLMLHSVIDAWGYAVFRSGALIRRSYGYDGTILGDGGSRLTSEIPYLANCDRLEVDGEILYRSRSHPQCEPLGVAFHGEQLAFEVCRSFTGYPLNAPELQQIIGADFWLNDDEDEFRARHGRRPWWKFWGESRFTLVAPIYPAKAIV